MIVLLSLILLIIILILILIPTNTYITLLLLLLLLLIIIIMIIMIMIMIVIIMIIIIIAWQPSRGLGGVARGERPSALLCEDFDLVFAISLSLSIYIYIYIHTYIYIYRERERERCLIVFEPGGRIACSRNAPRREWARDSVSLLGLPRGALSRERQDCRLFRRE